MKKSAHIYSRTLDPDQARLVQRIKEREGDFFRTRAFGPKETEIGTSWREVELDESSGLWNVKGCHIVQNIYGDENGDHNDGTLIKNKKIFWRGQF